MLLLPGGGGAGPPPPTPTTPYIPSARPSTRKIDIRSLSYGMSGPVQPYPVYQFSAYVYKIEYDRHAYYQGGANDNLGHPGTVVSAY